MKLPTKPGNFVKKCARNNATVACLWGVYIRNCRKISSFWVPRLHTAPVGMKFSMGESTPSRKILPQFWNLLTYWTKNLKITPEYLNTGVCAARIVPVIIETITIDLNIYTVFQKSDAKIEITITTINLIRIKYPLSSFNYRLSGTNIAKFNKIHCTVSEQQLFNKKASIR